MIEKSFKPGDIVHTLHDTFPIEVVTYLPERVYGNGKVSISNKVLCKWKEGNRVHYKIFNHNRLKVPGNNLQAI